MRELMEELYYKKRQVAEKSEEVLYQEEQIEESRNNL